MLVGLPREDSVLIQRHSKQPQKPVLPRRKRVFVWGLCGLVFDVEPQAFGIDPACSACVSQLAQAVGFDRAFFDQFVKPGTAYAETFTSVGNTEVFDRDSSEMGMCRARVRHMT